MTQTQGTSKTHLSVLLGLALLCAFGVGLGVVGLMHQQAAGVRMQEAVDHQSIPLRRELVRLDSRVETLTRFFREAEELEREARFLAGLDVNDHVPLNPATFTWDYERHPIGEDNYRDLQLLLAATTGISQLAQQVHHTADSYEDIATAMLQDAPQWAKVPSITPVREARQSSDFGRRRDPFTGQRKHHKGVDLVGPYGTAIYASASGKVTWAGWAGGYGKLVEIDHGNGIRTRYAHNSRLVVRAGEYVRRGQVIARLGDTGRANAPHLHYEVLVDGRARNPGYVAGDPIRAE